ncbi:MAG: hypothetical protein ACPHQ8_02350 [Candidatus Puniceispirillaceae bacterium]
MKNLVSPALLVAAGIAISACNVSTGGVTPIHYNNEDSGEQLVGVSQATVNNTPASVDVAQAPAAPAASSSSRNSSSAGTAGTGGNDRVGTAAAQSGGSGDVGELHDFVKAQAFQHQNAANLPTGGAVTTTRVPNNS